MSTIFRTQKDPDNPFVMMDKRPIHDRSISWAAKGMLAYLLSKPNDWTVILTDVEKQSTDGREKVRSVVKELISAGYIIKHEYREHGKFQTSYEVYETPKNPAESTVTAKPRRLDRDGEPDTTNNDLVRMNTNISASEENPSSLPQSLSDEMLDKLPIEWQIKAGKEKIVMPDAKEMEILDRADLIAMGTGINHPIYKGIAYAFMKERGIIIPESKVKGQRKAVREMVEQGVLPNHAQMATRKLMEAGMTVVDLFAISKTAIDLANPVNGPDFSQPQESRFESMDDLGE